jgi:hypothetical protein
VLGHVIVPFSKTEVGAVRPHPGGQRTPCPSSDVGYDCANALPRASGERAALFGLRLTGLKMGEVRAIKARVRASPHLHAAVLWDNSALCMVRACIRFNGMTIGYILVMSCGGLLLEDFPSWSERSMNGCSPIDLETLPLHFVHVVCETYLL